MRSLSRRVTAKAAIILSVILFAGTVSPGHASAAMPKTKSVAGKSLKLLGTALREFLFIDIYKLSAYSESGECKQSSVIYKSEVKMLVLSMKKTLPKKRLVSTLRETFMNNLPEGKDNTELKNKIDVFLSYFTKDIKKGSYLEIIYIPGRGTMLKQNGAQLGKNTKGKGFSDLVWRSYFGPKTCCPGLKSDIIQECKAQ